MNSPSRDAYANWASAYPPYAHNALMEVEEAAVMMLLPPVSNRRVLDAGCGTGRYMRLLGALGAHVAGIDLSPAMLVRARFVRAAVSCGDLAALPFAPDSFDAIVSGLALMDVPNLEPVTAEWARVLQPRGVVVYSTLHPRGRELGWTRTYEGSSGSGTLPAYWHTRADHERACRGAGLEIEAVEEPALTQSDPPVALVVRARRIKPCSEHNRSRS